MKHIIYCLLIIPLLVSCNEPELTNIKGTRILMTPPKGFVQSENIIGFTKENKSLIQVYDILESYYIYSNSNFSKENFEARGAKVLDSKDITVNGFPGKLYYLELDNTHYGYCTVFGDSTFCASLLGSYESIDEATGEQIKEAFVKAQYDKSIPVSKTNPKVVFKLNDSKSILKIAKKESNVMVFALNGLSKVSYNPEPYLVASQIAFDQKSSTEEITNLMLGNIRTYGLSSENIKKQEKRIVNGYQSFETELTGEINGQTLGYYLLVIIHNDKAVSLEGYCFSNFKNNFEEFRNLANTIEFVK